MCVCAIGKQDPQTFARSFAKMPSYWRPPPKVHLDQATSAILKAQVQKHVQENMSIFPLCMKNEKFKTNMRMIKASMDGWMDGWMEE